MVRAAAQIPPRLHAAVAAADDPLLPIAEISRRVGARAEELGLIRPSYETVRRLVGARRRARPEPAAVAVAVEVVVRAVPPDTLGAYLTRAQPPGRRD